MPPTAERPGTAKRGAARTPAAHTAGVAAGTPPGDEDAAALEDALALIDLVDERVSTRGPCKCGQHEAVHECARATGRRRWVLSVPPYVIYTEMSREGARHPRVAIKAFATEDEAWAFQKLIRDAHKLDMRSSAAVTPPRARVASASRAKRRMELGAAAPQAPAAVPARAAQHDDDGWEDAYAAGGGGFDPDEAGPSTVPPRRATKPAVVQQRDERDELTRLAEQYIGSRVFFDGAFGTVKGIDADLEDGYRFNVRYDDYKFGDIALRDIKDAVAAAAAEGHHPASVPAVPAQLQTPSNNKDDEVIVISDDDDDVPATQEQARRGSQVTPAPAAPPPRRNARKSSQPIKRGRPLPDEGAAPPDEVIELDGHAAAAAAAPAKRARRSLHDAAAPQAVAAADATDAVAQTQPAAPVLDLSALPQTELARLSSVITLKLTCGEVSVGKLGQGDVKVLLRKLVALDLKLLSAFVNFEDHGDERRLCTEWRALLLESA